jgi:two-component sensor histidine kinase
MLHIVESAKGYSRRTFASVTAACTDNEVRPPAIVERYEILDTPPEPAFDRITALAATLFDAPISIISFLDGNRLWFKSHHGFAPTEISWAPGIYASTIEPRFRRGLDLGFFAGAPLVTHDGHELGSLCVIDRQPRQVDERRIGQLRSLAAVVMDLLEQRLAARRAAAQAKILAGEIDHRVMNSLQFVASLLRLQSKAVEGAATVQALTTAANRVLAVARAHRHFSTDETADHAPVLAYLRRLCGELSGLLTTDIRVEGSEASVPTSQILPIGLLVNELATNAKKHGAGPIHITFTTGADGQYELCVLDEGKGLPEGFNLDHGSGLGMKVVNALVQQLGGRLSASANPAGRGACFTVAFPATTRHMAD